ncbi:MAG: hypothetical protein M0031_00905 [Thermaerobacter sp.]|nr:hypothetical protein [Thermaerobacter sp.]
MSRSGKRDEAFWSGLEPGQRRRLPLGRRRITRGLRVLLWCLRLYVLLMLALVVIRVMRTF